MIRKLLGDNVIAMSSRIWMALVALALLFHGGGASAQSKTKQDSGDPRGAVIYVYRETMLVGSLNFDVPFLHLDGRQLTRIKMGGYIPIKVSPGTHELTTTESFFGNDSGKIRGRASVWCRLEHSYIFDTAKRSKALPPSSYLQGSMLIRRATIASKQCLRLPAKKRLAVWKS